MPVVIPLPPAITEEGSRLPTPLRRALDSCTRVQGNERVVGAEIVDWHYGRGQDWPVGW